MVLISTGTFFRVKYFPNRQHMPERAIIVSDCILCHQLGCVCVCVCTLFGADNAGCTGTVCLVLVYLTAPFVCASWRGISMVQWTLLGVAAAGRRIPCIEGCMSSGIVDSSRGWAARAV